MRKLGGITRTELDCFGSLVQLNKKSISQEEQIKNMKKFTTLLALVSILGVIAAGCGSKAEEGAAAGDAGKTAPAAEEKK